MKIQELKENLEKIPDDADVTFCTVTWWDEDGCHNWDSDSVTQMEEKRNG